MGTLTDEHMQRYVKDREIRNVTMKYEDNRLVAVELRLDDDGIIAFSADGSNLQAKGEWPSDG